MRRALLIALLLVTGFCIGIAYATSFSETYDIATPAGSDDPAEADDRMREIKAAIQERLNVEHVYDLTGTEVSHADTGKHTDITCDSIANAGAYSGTTITASSTLDVAGNIDPTTYETTNGGFLDEDDMASDANDKVASQQSIKKYVDDTVAANVLALGNTTIQDDDNATMLKSHAYLCNQDGMVEVIITEGGGTCEVIGYDDSDSNPAAGGDVRAHFETDHYGAVTVQKSFTFLMASGRYFEIVATSATVTIRWVPFGTLIKCTDQD